jgi:hypothetical protein
MFVMSRVVLHADLLFHNTSKRSRPTRYAGQRPSSTLRSTSKPPTNMDLSDIPLPDSLEVPRSPDAAAVPSAVAAGLSASPAISVVAQDPPDTFLAQLRRFATATISFVINCFAPAPVREGWVFLFSTAYNKITTSTAEYRFGFLAIAVLVALAESQQPGFISRPQYISNAVIGFICALCLAFGVVAMLDYIETARWPWEQDGWVWPWQVWLWQRTAYDLGASTTTQTDGLMSPLPPATSATKASPPALTFGSPTAQTTSSTPAENAITFDFSMPPPATVKQTMIIPPTPQLPRGLRPIHLPPATPAQVHKSGILGESPMPPKFEHFSGSGLSKHNEKLEAVAEWASPRTSNLLREVKKNVPSMLSKKRVSGESDDERTVKKATAPHEWRSLPSGRATFT